MTSYPIAEPQVKAGTADEEAETERLCLISSLRINAEKFPEISR
jgi:hypothetical protein